MNPEMIDYLITLRPLEPFLFGGEHNFDYGSKRQTPQRYYIASEDRPSQTTLFGTLRYAVLAANNALITEFGNKEQIERANALVGRQSFRFTDPNQNFGVIEGISPLFLIHHREEGISTLIPLPMNHGYDKDNISYKPCTLVENKAMTTNRGFSAIYATDRDPKHSVKGWMSLEDGKIYPNYKIFTESLQVGINAHRTEGIRDQENSFFKKSKMIFAEPQDRFAFYAKMALNEEAMEAFARGIPVSMGQGKTPFILTAVPKVNTLNTDIQKALGEKNGENRSFIYCASDAYVKEMPDCFFFAETKPFRHLVTDLSQKVHLHRLNRTDTLYRLICAGAVFYGEAPEKLDNASTIGLNEFIKIGGKS